MNFAKRLGSVLLRLKCFMRNTDGNVAVMLGLSVIPLIAVMGMSVDYTLAGRRESAVNAIADAAALSTTTPAAMSLSATVAKTNAINMFNAQVAVLTGITYSSSNLTVTVTDTTTSATVSRATVVTYTATSTNAFSGLLKMSTIAIGGTSKAANATAPNIDFYLLLDTSPSMAIPSSQSGIDTMVANTSAQGGCAFACHESNPSSGDVVGNPNGEDNYTLARNLGVTLRIDLIKQATANLITTAASTEASNKAVYRVATYTFDATFQTITSLTTALTTSQSGSSSNAYNDATNKINMLIVANDQGYLTTSQYNNDEDTQFDSAMANSAYIPNPGNGTNVSGDTPQEVLFIVTDGVIDEAYPGYGSTYYTDSSNRTITTIGYQKDYCTTVKARNIRIAVLYTTYNPLPTNAFYVSRVAPFQSTIATALKSCASPGLFFQVDTGGDINAAMQTLFTNAVTSAHLVQ